MTKQRISSRLKNPVPLFAFLLVVLASFFVGIYRERVISFIFSRASIFAPQTGDTVSALTLKSTLNNKNFTLINVHVPYEGEIEKTDTFVAFDKLVEQSAFLPKDKTAPIILYCKSGRMSAEALITMRKMGYTDVRHLAGGMDVWRAMGQKIMDLSSIEDTVVPAGGVVLPFSLGDLGPKLVEAGVIDLPKFKGAVRLTTDQENVLTQGTKEKLHIDRTNGQFVVDVLWALGLAQKSIVYDEGPMGKEYKKNAGNFASTGGWSLSSGPAMNYLNKFDFISFTSEQQHKVAEIAKNVFRPCCGNSTWFPDCNHGMAALAAIELMVSANIPEKEIYKAVLALNSYWFTDSYVTAAIYFARQGIPWDKVDAKEVLGEQFSSGKGAATITQRVGPLPYRPRPSAGGCGA